jgi:aspartate-semialdehyde dehydrogenase
MSVFLRFGDFSKKESRLYMRPLRIGLVGATGLVGRAIAEHLGQQVALPIEKVVPFASPASKGKPFCFRGQVHPVGCLEEDFSPELDLVFFDATDAVSRKWVPIFTSHGVWVIDNAAVFRLHTEAPLIVPEWNGAQLVEHVRAWKKNPDHVVPRLSGPNCTTVQLVLALQPFLDFGLKRLVISTYQSVSGAGQAALQELKQHAAALLTHELKLEPHVFPRSIALHCLPQVGALPKHSFETSEEAKVSAEVKRLLGLPELEVEVTAVRVPVLRGHAESIFLETEKDIDWECVHTALQNSQTLVQVEPFPTTEDIKDAGKVYVGRMRPGQRPSSGHVWCVADNLERGAAFNAVRMAEMWWSAFHP